MKAKLYTALLVVFISGLCIGFFAGQYLDRQRVHHLMQRGPERIERVMIDRLASQLDLDAKQRQFVAGRVGALARAMDEEHRLRGQAVRERMLALLTDIRPVLNPGQRTILDTINVDDLRPRPPLPPFPPGVQPPHPGGNRPPPPRGDDDPGR